MLDKKQIKSLGFTLVNPIPYTNLIAFKEIYYRRYSKHLYLFEDKTSKFDYKFTTNKNDKLIRFKTFSALINIVKRQENKFMCWVDNKMAEPDYYTKAN